MKKGLGFLLSIILLGSLISCNNQETTTPSIFDRDKGNTAYQLLIYAFDSSNGDELGDLEGIRQRLDYLKDLGITLIWLSPIHEASSYHGYDVIDYYSINKDYGTLDDFKNLINDAHERGISIILDMVLNHTSSAHPWFIDACNNKNNKRDWYVWKKDGVTYGSGGGYTGRFYESSTCNGAFFSSFTTSMPDLNLANKEVVNEQKKILKYWLDLGVDGFRFDAIKHFFDIAEYDKERNTLNDINKYFKEINGFIHSYKKNSYIIGEYLEMDYRGYIKFAPYFDSEFDFYTYDQIIKIVNGASPRGYINNYKTAQQALLDKNRDWYNSVIISNHDLDRVMSRVESENKAKLALNMQMLLPGMPYVYYGDEIGLKGVRYKNNDIERRLPMKWGDTWYWINADKYGAGFYREEINNDVLSVSEQLEDEESLLNYYKKVINFRNAKAAIYKGQVSEVDLGNINLIAYKSKHGNDELLVIHNKSYSSIEIDKKSEYKDIIFNQELITTNNNKIVIPSYTSVVIQL